MKKFLFLVGVVGLALLLGGVDQSEAVPITFNFNPLTNNSTSTVISTYMTGIYGSTVTVTGARSSSNSAIPAPPTPWTGNTTQYIRTDIGAAGDFEISFDVVPIVSIQAGSRGFIFTATILADFVLSAYNSNFTAGGGTRENPNIGALVTPIVLSNIGAGSEVVFPDIIFSEPVTLLVISDSGSFDVGIDDLTVTPIPEPSSLVLFSLGVLGLIGYCWRRRKRAA
ncbi:PEP-CTERM sorting domain-containing protein [Candidatus Poribacteria bacterium]|nr:PEP-CTERM sorting domain-containing protein [Candidatus Poribacteria bacterium]